ncbi:hypothetical protein SALWKB29_0928 [Snodgrassella communis]|uniref:Uncharacterized protein n=1 Tax=Snodgrassella communis TaxID=2946699 RepID=A0A836MPS4_9NEIS|nr:hypothetical protein SALWKB29_0928 [Snodgrassella communis]
MTIFVARIRHLEAYMLRLFPPSMILMNITQTSSNCYYIDLRENNSFKPDIYSFISYKLN